MNKDGTSLLWEQYGTIEDAHTANSDVKFYSMLGQIRWMAVALTHKESRLKGNQELLKDIEYAMDIVDKYWYSPDLPWYGFLWNAMTGSPKSMPAIF